MFRQCLLFLLLLAVVVLGAYDCNGGTVSSTYTTTDPTVTIRNGCLIAAVFTFDVGNMGTTKITVNITADPGPLGIEWTSPYYSQEITKSNFPFTVSVRINDQKSIDHLKITAVNESGNTIDIGSVDHPALPNLSFTWTDPPPKGQYQITVHATLVTGDERTENIPVNVR